MEVWHKRTRLRYIFNDFICQKVRFNRRNSITFNTFYRIECLNQIKERFACRFPEIAYINTGYNDFLSSLLSYMASLNEKLLDEALDIFGRVFAMPAE